MVPSPPRAISKIELARLEALAQIFLVEGGREGFQPAPLQEAGDRLRQLHGLLDTRVGCHGHSAQYSI